MNRPSATWLRYVGSFGLAGIVVLAMLMSGLRMSGFIDREDPQGFELHQVDVLSEAQRWDLAERLGGAGNETSPGLPPLPEIPPMGLSRSVQGFVQLEVIVAEDGSVRDVRVIGAAPAGVYEEAAIAQIQSKRYPVGLNDGGAGTSRRLEIVDFRLSGSELNSLGD